MPNYEYLKGENAGYIDELYERYLEDPQSVDNTWRYFFEGMELGPGDRNGHGGGAANVISLRELKSDSFDLSAEAKVAELITAYRERGRLLANTDPLSPPAKHHPLLELSVFGLTEKDLVKTFTAGKLIGMGPSTLSDILDRLKEIYCSSIAVEYTHIQDPVSREWLKLKMEASRNKEALAPEVKKRLLRRLTESECFEKFLHTRYVAQKRFSIEGGEALIPALDRTIEVGAELGANNVVMGMAHRGRLNVLTTIYGKKPEHIFTEFEQNYNREGQAGEGDVKYHMGFSADVVTSTGKPVHLSLAHNPSHLEFVNPVVEGIARSKQRDMGDTERNQVIPILIHGDAAFAGQGIVYETLGFSQLKGYETGGTIHFIIDNQIGFTTDPEDSRSTTYATDLAKMLEVPIFHVNGDDPEAVWYVSRLATEYRQKFKKDVFIDLICYRRYGHNEGDEPEFTQPLKYKVIKKHPTPRAVYATRLEREGVVPDSESKGLVDEQMQLLTKSQEITRTEKPKPFSSSYQSKWKNLRPSTEADMFQIIETAVPESRLKDLIEKIHHWPSDFSPHRKLKKMLEARIAGIREGKPLDWGAGELIAYATLLTEGHPIRLSGQDVERGTFTHRHAVLHDPESGREYASLNNLADDQAEFIVQNSSLSEAGILGFEYGWSLADPNALVIWEAQFGDFANGAQVIIDQFIASSESKWQRASGLVLFLPHGYEGQGPEHSSARLERFLQLCGKQNMSVCNFTTPAQVFHSLRRQLKRDFRKPMVVMTPKSLLRHPKAQSSLADMASGHFQESIDDALTAQDPSQVKRVLLCSGKVYYDLLEEQEKRGSKEVAILRVEQLYPWPKDRLAAQVNQYSNAQQIFWVQEEPKNMGAWSYVFATWNGGFSHFYEMVGNRMIGYIGRERGAAPAVGSAKVHQKEQREIIEKAFSF